MRGSLPEEVLMLERYDFDDTRERDVGGLDRQRGGRGATTQERERSVDPRDVFVRDLNLPRDDERRAVSLRDRSYELRASESRTLATVGAFRVVSASDLRDHDGRPLDVRTGDLRHLRESGLVDTVRVEGRRDHVVTLTKDGRDLLNSHRRSASGEARQAFYAGVRKPRELGHDVHVYRAYERAAKGIVERGGRLRRVVLDYELKRDYQRFLQERNRRSKSDGRPDREEHEIRDWALTHDLPYFDEQVHFPDVRIEWDDERGRSREQDIEVTTEHYRGAHAAAAARSGFSRYQAGSVAVFGGGGRGRGRRGGGAPGLAEEMLS
jgi:hypothetical protein